MEEHLFNWQRKICVPLENVVESGTEDEKNYIEQANFEDTGFCYTLSLISGKHKPVILYCLMEFKIVRFNECFLKH